MLFVFFWVIPRRLIYICRRFGTLFHLQRHGTDRVFRNVGIYKSDAGESPKRKQTTNVIFEYFFKKSARKSQVSLKYDTNNGYCT